MLTDTTFWIDLIEERIAQRRGPAHQFIAAQGRFYALSRDSITRPRYP